MSAEPLAGELVHMPAGQAALLDDPARLAALPEEDFRVWCSEALSAAKKYMAPLGHPVGIMLAEANRRWEKAEYTSFVEECEKTIGVSRSTLWRWRSQGEKALGITPERPNLNRATRQEAPSISPKAEPSISAQEVAVPHSEEPPTSSPPAVGPATPSSSPDRHGDAGEPRTPLVIGHETPAEAGPSPDRERHGVQREAATGSSPSGLVETPPAVGRLVLPEVPTVDDLNLVLVWLGRVNERLFFNVDSLALTVGRRRLNGEQERREHVIRENGPLARKTVTPLPKVKS